MRGITKTIGPDGKMRLTFDANGSAAAQPPQPASREIRREEPRTNAGTRTHVEEDGKDYYIDNATGKMDGPFRRWRKSGKQLLLIEECNYEQGLLHGKLTCWYEDGKRSREAYYEKGMLKGPSKTWYPSGLPASEEEWDGGMFPLVRKEFYERYSGDGAFSSGCVKSLMWTIGEQVKRTIEWAQDGQVIADKVEDLSRSEADEEEKWGPLPRLAALADKTEDKTNSI